MLAFKAIAHQLHLRLVGFLQQFQDSGVAELFVDAAFGLVELVTVHPRYGLLGRCHLADHFQLRSLRFVEDAILVIEVGYFPLLLRALEYFIVLL